jgi:hypothetical protein
MQSICIHKKNVMPANLNALIRYKTIDKCLSNPYRKWTIEDLMEACSMALKENRGILTGISERTIREDIRVMRSDILGFNAPIVQREGNYFYEDRAFSIFNVSIQDSELLKRVLKFIIQFRKEVDHPDMEDIIQHIFEALPGHELDDDLKDIQEKKDPEPDEESIQEELDLFEPLSEQGYISIHESASNLEISWTRILNLI